MYKINECLIYILNSYPAEAYIKNRNDILTDIKIAGNSKMKNNMNSIILKLIGEYQKSLNNLNNNNNDDDNNKFDELIYNKILKFLNKIKIKLEKLI